MKTLSELHIPLPEKTNLKLGFMRLSDSAPMIMAKELGLFEEVGLNVELNREVSWANLRDRLAIGDLDAAQLLSPLPMMSAYGVVGIRTNLITGLVLSLNGNAITLSPSLWNLVNTDNIQVLPDPQESSKKLRQYLDSGSNKPRLTFATVHLFSMHTILLRMWLMSGNIDPDRDVKIIVLPPEQMCDSLSRGIIDGYCVGEPWNNYAVQNGIGSVICTGYQIWNNVPEKVLAVTETWHQQFPSTHLRLRLALMKSCEYLEHKKHIDTIADILSQPRYLDMPKNLLLPSLSGNFQFNKNQSANAVPEFHVFNRYQAGFPWRSISENLIKRCCFAFSSPITDDTIKSLSQQCYRPDLFRDAARHLGIVAPSKDVKHENSHTGEWEMEPGVLLGADRFLHKDGA